MGSAAWTIAIGEQMRDAAEALEKKTGVRSVLFDRLTGLAPNDDLMGFLAKISGKPVPSKISHASAASSSTPCSTGISSSAARGLRSAPSPICCGRCRAGCRDGLHHRRGGHDDASRRFSKKCRRNEVLIGDLEDLESGGDGLRPARHPRPWPADGRAAAASRSSASGLPMFDRLGAAHRVVDWLSRHARSDFRNRQHVHGQRA